MAPRIRSGRAHFGAEPALVRDPVERLAPIAERNSDGQQHGHGGHDRH